MSWTQGGWTAESGGENASVAAAPVSSAVASGAGEDGGGGGVCSSADADAGGVEVASSADCIASEADARAESTVERPLIGATMEPLSTLAAEYEHGAAAFRSKIAALGAKYGALRRVRGDGNCFFRGVTFAYLEVRAPRPRAARSARAPRAPAPRGVRARDRVPQRRASCAAAAPPAAGGLTAAASPAASPAAAVARGRPDGWLVPTGVLPRPRRSRS